MVAENQVTVVLCSESNVSVFTAKLLKLLILYSEDIHADIDEDIDIEFDNVLEVTE